LHALLEGFHALGDVAHDVGDLAAAEQQQHDHQDDNPMPDTAETHDQAPPAGGLMLSSSLMFFLKALMPLATSPIRPEILPVPNSSTTTRRTMPQCSRLKEPMAQLLQWFSDGN